LVGEQALGRQPGAGREFTAADLASYMVGQLAKEGRGAARVGLPREIDIVHADRRPPWSASAPSQSRIHHSGAVNRTAGSGSHLIMPEYRRNYDRSTIAGNESGRRLPLCRLVGRRAKDLVVYTRSSNCYDQITIARKETPITEEARRGTWLGAASRIWLCTGPAEAATISRYIRWI
jgi:hypothetical protein